MDTRGPIGTEARDPCRVQVKDRSLLWVPLKSSKLLVSFMGACKAESSDAFHFAFPVLQLGGQSPGGSQEVN